MIASEKSHQNLSDWNQFLFIKRFKVDEKQIFPSELMRNSGNCIYDYAHLFFGEDGFFPGKNLQTSPPPHSSGHIYMKESHGKSIFRFLFWAMADCIYNLRWHTWILKCVIDENRPKVIDQFHRKCAQWAETNGKSIFRFFVSEIWSILYCNSEKHLC